MTPETLASITQFGIAGLIGWMWLSERRAAAERERQLSAAHEAIMQDRARLDILIAALDANTRAITALEVGQRQLIAIVEFQRSGGAQAPGPPQHNSLSTPHTGATGRV